MSIRKLDYGRYLLDIRHGGNIITLQRILGHATIQQTMTYAHFAQDYLADAMKFNPVAGISIALP